MDTQLSQNLELVLQRGMRAEHEGRPNEANVCLSLVAPFLDHAENLAVVVALGRIEQGRFDEAAEMLEAVGASFPENGCAKTALALARRGQGDPGWRQMCGEVLASSTDPQARRMAEQVLVH
jgi:hypothetical protein